MKQSTEIETLIRVVSTIAMAPSRFNDSCVSDKNVFVLFASATSEGIDQIIHKQLPPSIDTLSSLLARYV